MSQNIADLSATLAPQVSAVRKAPADIAQGLAQGTQVMTMDGMIPVEYLHPGDRIITRAGMRRLAALDVTEYDSTPTCRIAASVLGRDKPENDITVGPATSILLRDWRARALYDCDQVLVPAARLADGAYITMEHTPARCRFFSLVFETREVFYANGLEVASAS